MKIRSMRVEIALAQPINRENSYAIIGGFSFRYTDGTQVEFDFEDSQGWIQRNGESIIFELSHLDDNYSSIPESLTAEDFVCPTEITEFYHEFLNDAEHDKDCILMERILWWTFEIDEREYSLSQEVLEKYNSEELKSIDESIKKELQ